MRTESFNSLQTGKCIQSFHNRSSNQCAKSEFQFPSNGKVYPKSHENRKSLLDFSFNSLQTGKCIQRQTFAILMREPPQFQFPSNGKVYPKIPSSLFPKRTYYRFQFPSNGKVYPKQRTERNSPERNHVSIPFKRESVSKGQEGVNPMLLRKVSIPFKRESVSKGFLRFRRVGGISVSIPFKRESVSKAHRAYRGTQPNQVSIPFKRESVSKETLI